MKHATDFERPASASPKPPSPSEVGPLNFSPGSTKDPLTCPSSVEPGPFPPGTCTQTGEEGAPRRPSRVANEAPPLRDEDRGPDQPRSLGTFCPPKDEGPFSHLIESHTIGDHLPLWSAEEVDFCREYNQQQLRRGFCVSFFHHRGRPAVAGAVSGWNPTELVQELDDAESMDEVDAILEQVFPNTPMRRALLRLDQQERRSA